MGVNVSFKKFSLMTVAKNEQLFQGKYSQVFSFTVYYNVLVVYSPWMNLKETNLILLVIRH